MISVVLIEPENAGNVGAIARVMANFGMTDLWVVRPKCDLLGKEAQDRAKHAKTTLKRVHLASDFREVREAFDYLISTSSEVGTDYHLLRTPITPQQLGSRLAELDHKKLKIGLVFGREGLGMVNDEIKQCDFLVTIPTHRDYKSMNLSHAVAVICYEVFRATAEDHIIKHFRPITQTEIKQIDILFDEVFSRIPWPRKTMADTQRRLWKHIIGRSMLSKRESYAVMGLLRAMANLPR